MPGSNPVANNRFEEEKATVDLQKDPYNPKFSRTDNAAIRAASNGGSLTFGDLVSGGTSS